MNDFLNEIIKKHNISKLKVIKGGYSFDDKYIALIDNQKYILKIFDIIEYQKVKKAKEFTDLFKESDVKLSTIKYIGKSESKCYSIATYIEGYNGNDITKIDNSIHYSIGQSAAKDLLTIHSKTFINYADLDEFYLNKVNNIVDYLKSENFFSDEYKLLYNFVVENINHLKNRLIVLSQGDYHLENMAFDNHGYNGIFDYNRVKEADYLRDLERVITFSSIISKDFVKGFLKTYNLPDSEWIALCVYLAAGALAHAKWVLSYFRNTDQDPDLIARVVLNDFNNFKSIKPYYLGE